MSLAYQRSGRRGIAAALVLFASITLIGAHAQSAIYQVEVIVFERNTPDATAAGGGGVLGPAATGVPPQALAPSQLLLASAARALQRSGRYTLLVHIGWQQSTEAGRPVRVTSKSLSVEGRPIVDGDVRLAAGRELTLQALLHCLYNGQDMVLRGDRRLRLGELHYFDHPVFGMLVQVTRVNALPE